MIGSEKMEWKYDDDQCVWGGGGGWWGVQVETEKHDFVCYLNALYNIEKKEEDGVGL